MNIYWDTNGQKLVSSLYSETQVTQQNFYLRDVIPVELILVKSQVNTGQPWAVDVLTAGDSIRFGAKEAYADAAFLFSQATWTASGSGTTQKYSADISLNAAALIAAMSAVDTIDTKAEFTIVKSDNSNSLSMQFTIRITRDVIIGTEGVPTTAFSVIEQFTDTDGVAKVRLVNGAGVTCFVAAPL